MPLPDFSSMDLTDLVEHAFRSLYNHNHIFRALAETVSNDLRGDDRIEDRFRFLVSRSQEEHEMIEKIRDYARRSLASDDLRGRLGEADHEAIRVSLKVVLRRYGATQRPPSTELTVTSNTNDNIVRFPSRAELAYCAFVDGPYLSFLQHQHALTKETLDFMHMHRDILQRMGEVPISPALKKKWRALIREINAIATAIDTHADAYEIGVDAESATVLRDVAAEMRKCARQYTRLAPKGMLKP